MGEKAVKRVKLSMWRWYREERLSHLKVEVSDAEEEDGRKHT